MSAFVIVEVDNDGFKVLNTLGTAIDPATDAVLQAVRDRIGEVSATPTANTVQERLQQLQTALTSLDGKDFATQTTLATLATESKLETVRVLLASIDGKDFATETKLEQVRVLLASLDGKDFATETKLEAVRALLALLEAKDFATQTTLATLATETKLEAVRVLLASIDGKDFATETTLAARATQTTAAAIQAVLEAIRDTAGVKKITDELPAGTQDIGSFRLRDILGNGISSVLNNAIRRLEARSSLTSADGVGDVGTVYDSAEGLYRLATTGKVSITVPPPPAGGTSVTIAADNPLSTGAHDTEYVVPSGKTFHVQQIVAGAAGDPNEKGSKITVIFDDGTEHVIERIYVSGFTNFGSYPDTQGARDGTTLMGNGTNKIIVRREKISGTNREIDAVVRGFVS